MTWKGPVKSYASIHMSDMGDFMKEYEQEQKDKKAAGCTEF